MLQELWTEVDGSTCNLEKAKWSEGNGHPIDVYHWGTGHHYAPC